MKKSIWKIKNGLPVEYYYIGNPFSGNKSIKEDYAFYATLSGHFPERVYLADNQFFSTKNEAVQAAIKMAESLIKLLNEIAL